jgi:hypothetical protein
MFRLALCSVLPLSRITAAIINVFNGCILSFVVYKIVVALNRLTNIGAEMCDMRNGIDLPVEGPINREPEEKLYPRGSGTPSIIRRM